MAGRSLSRQQSPPLDANAETAPPISLAEREALLTPTNTNDEVASHASVSSAPATRQLKAPNIIARLLVTGPLLGILALVITVCCAFFSFAILVTSDNQPVSTWVFQPSVYIAIASAIANSAVSVAYAQAAAVAWWHRASRGASIRKLERQWEASFSLGQALLSPREMSLVVAVTLLVALIKVDGPLLQRASSVIVATQSKMVDLSFALAPELPTGFSGYTQDVNLVMSSEVIQICQDWTHHTPIPLPVHPAYEGSCVGKVQGPGITVLECSPRIWPISPEMYHDPHAIWGGRSGGVYLNSSNSPENPIFEIFMGINMLFGPNTTDPTRKDVLSEAVDLIVGLIEVFNGSGKYSETTCVFVPAILEYDVVFTGDGHVSLVPNSDLTGHVVSLANNTHAYDVRNPHAQASTMDFLTTYLSALVRAKTRAYAPIPGSKKSGSDVWYADAGTLNSQGIKYSNFSNGPLDDNFLDPTLDIINSFNEMLFRAGVSASNWSNLAQLMDPGLSPNQSIAANQTVTHNVFHSDFRWYAAATALEIFVVLTVLPMFWGYWTLDKHLSLSPVSLGLAFDAPLLRDGDESKGTSSVIEQLGHKHVRFGAVAEEKKGSDGQAEKGGKNVSDVVRMRLVESHRISQV